MKKILVGLELLFLLSIIETLIFFRFSTKGKLKILKHIPSWRLGYRDEQIVSFINSILYRNVLGIRFMNGNCVRYVMLLYSMFKRKYSDLKVIIGVKKRQSGLIGHTWLESCSKLFYEPENTRKKYIKMGEFKG